jgi:hypothetical protein
LSLFFFFLQQATPGTNKRSSEYKGGGLQLETMAAVGQAASQGLQYVSVDVLMNKLVQAHENEANHIEKEVKSMFRY